MLPGLLATAAPAPPPVNIVCILADDLGYGELGCYGQQHVPTPNIDRLAREGIRFTRFYAASPVCAPTRCSLLTGKHQGHAAVRGNKERGAFDVRGLEGQFPLPRSERTIAGVLRRAGYATALVGKWGLGSPLPGQRPNDHGFDRFYGLLCQRRAHDHYPAYLWSDFDVDPLPGNVVRNAHQRLSSPLESEDEYYERYGGGTYAPEAMADQAVRFVRENSRRPFFLYYAPTLPHVTLAAPRDWVDRFPREWDAGPYLGQGGYLPCARPRATYAAMIAYLDHTVGRILDELDRLGLAQNTLVVFTSDNGATTEGGVDRDFFRSISPLREGKRSLYEGGIRVPFVARWPGRIPAGSVSDVPAACYDLPATFAEVAGASFGRSDGVSLLPALSGGNLARRRPLYFEFGERGGMQAVILDGKIKVIRPSLSTDPSRVEVYDVAEDPSETRDLAASKPEWVRRGLKAMETERRPNPDFPLPGVDR
ncbi:MAG: arylsulfatase [Fimbriimonadaceae bacterium]